MIFDKFNEVEIFSEVQPILQPYLDDDIKLITKEILLMSLPPMIPRSLFDFKNLKISEY